MPIMNLPSTSTKFNMVMEQKLQLILQNCNSNTQNIFCVCFGSEESWWMLSARRNIQKEEIAGPGPTIRMQCSDLDRARHGWVRWLRGDAAHVATGADLQVAGVSP